MAGTVLMDRWHTEFAVTTKGGVDLVTDVDREAQDLIRKEILARYPGHGILAEEDLDIKPSEGYLWIVDPLDGTNNYAHHFPVFSVSIAVACEGETLCGVVYNPVSRELFQALRGQGARLDTGTVRVSETSRLHRCLLGTGFSSSDRTSTAANLPHFGNFALRTQGIRRCGSAALDLCFVACGRLDGFWEMDLKPWDIAAGALMVREAGGSTTDFQGAPLGLDGSRVLATNGRIHGEMMEILKGSV